VARGTLAGVRSTEIPAKESCFLASCLPESEKLSSIADKWEMKASFFLVPLTEDWAEEKPAIQAYVVAHVGRIP